jgi:hypothetical protein
LPNCGQGQETSTVSALIASHSAMDWSWAVDADVRTSEDNSHGRRRIWNSSPIVVSRQGDRNPHLSHSNPHIRIYPHVLVLLTLWRMRV